MSFISKRIVAGLLAVSVLASGCTNTTTAIDPSTMTPTEIALRQQQTERTRIVQGVATGAVVGALAGAAIGAIAGGDSRSITRGAIIGGVGGGVIGGADANRVNQQTRGIAAEQSDLRAIIANADKSIAHYSKINGLTGRLITEETARLTNSKKSLASGQMSKEAYRKQVESARGNVKVVSQYVDQADQDLNDLKRATANNNNAAAKQRVAQLTAQRNQLKNQLARMQTAVSRADS